MEQNYFYKQRNMVPGEPVDSYPEEGTYVSPGTKPPPLLRVKGQTLVKEHNPNGARELAQKGYTPWLVSGPSVDPWTFTGPFAL